MEIWIASGNRGKISEYKILLSSLPELQLHSQGELSYFSSPPENGASFVENARIKARALAAVKKGVWVLGEDSGLEVVGLGGLPGIHSARYAGPKAADAENRAKLLKMMQIRSAQKREARFVCSLVSIDPEGREQVFEAQLSGKIASKELGSQGFGYDSVFIPEGEEQSLAQLGLAYKNKHSHRALACRAFLESVSP